MNTSVMKRMEHVIGTSTTSSHELNQYICKFAA